MNPLRIQGANLKLLGNREQGVLDLHVIKSECETHGTSYTSAWEPTRAELDALLSGEPVLLTVYSNGGFPPVWVGVRGA